MTEVTTRRRGRPRKAEAGDTRAELTRAALDLFAAHGYEGTSVRAIARAVGLSESVLYAHFASKRAIFEAVLEELGPAGVVGVVEKAMRDLSDADPATFITTMIGRLVDEWSTRPSRQLISLMTKDGLIHDPALISGIAMSVSSVARQFAAWIEDSKIPAGLGDPADLAYALLSPVAMARLLWLHNDAGPAELAIARERSMRHAEFFIAALDRGTRP
jgi:AcrR family transcriptional regulator